MTKGLSCRSPASSIESLLKSQQPSRPWLLAAAAAGHTAGLGEEWDGDA